MHSTQKLTPASKPSSSSSSEPFPSSSSSSRSPPNPSGGLPRSPAPPGFPPHRFSSSPLSSHTSAATSIDPRAAPIDDGNGMDRAAMQQKVAAFMRALNVSLWLIVGFLTIGTATRVVMRIMENPSSGGTKKVQQGKHATMKEKVLPAAETSDEAQAVEVAPAAEVAEATS